MSEGLVSFSAISTYFECPHKYYLAYIVNAKPLFKPVYEFGRVIHEIIKTYYNLIPESITPKEVKLYLTQAVKKLGIDPTTRIPMLDNFARFEESRIAKSINSKPVAVEKEFTKPPFRGVVDVIFITLSGEKLVVDWKSSIKGDNETWERLRLQGNIYMYLTGASRALFYGLWRGNVEEFTYDEKYLMSKYEEFKAGVESKRFDRVLSDRCSGCEYNVHCLSALWGFEVLEL